MPEPVLSPAQYAGRHGAACPACGGDDIAGASGLEVASGGAWQAARCTGCGATWTDVYRLTGYADFEPGKKGSDA